jgi:sulfonate transport system substrate-binding protein
MKWKTAAGLIVCAVVVGLAVYFFGFRDRHPDEFKTVRLGRFSAAVDYGPYFVAQEKGWIDEVLHKHTVEAEYPVMQSLPPINEALITDRVDLMLEAEAPALIGRAAGADIKIVAIECRFKLELLVKADSPIKQVKDLKGKKVAVLAGTGPHEGVMKNLKAAGFRASDIEVVNMAPADAKAALAAGRIDAWVVWPPWIEEEELAGTGRCLPGFDAWSLSVVVVRSAFARRHPDFVTDYVRGIERGKQWIEKNPEEAQQLLGKQLNVRPEVVKQAWPRHVWTAKLDPATIADMQAIADFMKERDYVRKQVDVSAELVDSAFQDAAAR